MSHPIWLHSDQKLSTRYLCCGTGRKAPDFAKFEVLDEVRAHPRDADTKAMQGITTTGPVLKVLLVSCPCNFHPSR